MHPGNEIKEGHYRPTSEMPFECTPQDKALLTQI